MDKFKIIIQARNENDYFKVVGIVIFALFVSRFIPHPPNFTALIALSFYIH